MVETDAKIMWRVAADIKVDRIDRMRQYKTRINPLEDLDLEVFFDRYRFPKDVVFDLCNTLRPQLQHSTHCGKSLSIEIQVCTALYDIILKEDIYLLLETYMVLANVPQVKYCIRYLKNFVTLMIITSIGTLVNTASNK